MNSPLKNKLKDKKIRRVALIVLALICGTAIAFGTTFSGSGNGQQAEDGHSKVTAESSKDAGSENAKGKSDAQKNSAEKDSNDSSKSGQSQEKTQAAGSGESTSGTIKVTVSIRCDNALKRINDTWNDDSAKRYVPDSGVVLSAKTYTVSKGTTAYGLLKKACNAHNIQFEVAQSNAYGSKYVEAINYLYEMDVNSNSGWMYSINGNYPNYGSSDFDLKDGDVMVWAYTCNRGGDLGDRP